MPPNAERSICWKLIKLNAVIRNFYWIGRQKKEQRQQYLWLVSLHVRSFYAAPVRSIPKIRLLLRTYNWKLADATHMCGIRFELQQWQSIFFRACFDLCLHFSLYILRLDFLSLSFTLCSKACVCVLLRFKFELKFVSNNFDLKLMNLLH